MTDLGIAGIGDATLIASGGSALVYRAESSSGTPVAVKVLRGIRGNEVTRRFQREQSAANRLGEHPNIVAIRDHGLTETGEPYLVMPLMRRGSLADELEQRGAFDLRAAVDDVATAADAIDYAHSRGVLHRDLKPGNLLRADDGSISVTDFGIARVVDAGISSATISAATPLYAAPELLADNDATPQSDVYALGALLYALISGQPAFGDSSNLWATIHRVRTEDPAPIAGVPAPLMATIAQAMAKDPNERPPSARAFRENLTLALDADPAWRPPRPAAQTLDAPVPFSAVAPTDVPAELDLDSAMGDPHPADQAQPVRRRNATVAALAVASLALVGLLGWLGTRDGGDQVLAEGTVADSRPTEIALATPDTDGSSDGDELADPNLSTTPDPEAAGAASAEQAGTDDRTDGDPPVQNDRLVRFNGEWFSAYFPVGWSVAEADRFVEYGYRSNFVAGDMTLTIDTTPEHMQTGETIEQSAHNNAANLRSATPVQREVLGDDLVAHSFRFRNNQGHDIIDIFFEVDGDGYAILASSPTDPQAAFAVARQVATTIRSNK